MQNRYSTSSSFCNLPDCFQNCYTFCRQDGGDCVCLEDLKIVLLSISIPTVTARNSFRIVKAGLSEYCTASQKIISAVPPPLFRGEARVIVLGKSTAKPTERSYGKGVGNFRGIVRFWKGWWGRGDYRHFAMVVGMAVFEVTIPQSCDR